MMNGRLNGRTSHMLELRGARRTCITKGKELCLRRSFVSVFNKFRSAAAKGTQRTANGSLEAQGSQSSVQFGYTFSPFLIFTGGSSAPPRHPIGQPQASLKGIDAC